MREKKPLSLAKYRHQIEVSSPLVNNALLVCTALPSAILHTSTMHVSTIPRIKSRFRLLFWGVKLHVADPRFTLRDTATTARDIA